MIYAITLALVWVGVVICYRIRVVRPTQEWKRLYCKGDSCPYEPGSIRVERFNAISNTELHFNFIAIGMVVVSFVWLVGLTVLYSLSWLSVLTFVVFMMVMAETTVPSPLDSPAIGCSLEKSREKIAGLPIIRDEPTQKVRTAHLPIVDYQETQREYPGTTGSGG